MRPGMETPALAGPTLKSTKPSPIGPPGARAWVRSMYLARRSVRSKKSQSGLSRPRAPATGAPRLPATASAAPMKARREESRSADIQAHSNSALRDTDVRRRRAAGAPKVNVGRQACRAKLRLEGREILFLDAVPLRPDCGPACREISCFGFGCRSHGRILIDHGNEAEYRGAEQAAGKGHIVLNIVRQLRLRHLLLPAVDPRDELAARALDTSRASRPCCPAQQRLRLLRDRAHVVRRMMDVIDKRPQLREQLLLRGPLQGGHPLMARIGGYFEPLSEGLAFITQTYGVGAGSDAVRHLTHVADGIGHRSVGRNAQIPDIGVHAAPGGNRRGRRQPLNPFDETARLLRDWPAREPPEHAALTVQYLEHDRLGAAGGGRGELEADERPVGRIAADIRQKGRRSAALLEKIGFTGLEKVRAAALHLGRLCGELLERAQVIQDPIRAAFGRGDEIAPVHLEIGDRHPRKIELERLPVAAVIE